MRTVKIKEPELRAIRAALFNAIDWTNGLLDAQRIPDYKGGGYCDPKMARLWLKEIEEWKRLLRELFPRTAAPSATRAR